jgi:hypothetical protein
VYISTHAYDPGHGGTKPSAAYHCDRLCLRFDCGFTSMELQLSTEEAEATTEVLLTAVAAHKAEAKQPEPEQVAA